ncbi:MAG: hypothetical protein GTO45_00675 [Candidatus Aminicenantes bacterium]|nr:hypothetical protein [Candidatus Aminicenantes bacterium]NIM77276.1 hypothetical protein [Candidatus Aminicenantes bacterium]NIN16577.1 hypothetical protein [Candidatus Aminicenantes bacterium]NIN40435.1 hypothetical protein [Candidatus Aminicenantes bacterium]NIN83255.1 hypothetical protein [Candidatus Aminicenantes bacterium]
MRVRGKYRDVLIKCQEPVLDTGWKSNTIVQDYGLFLAGLMKKEFNRKIGIEYILVGSGSEEFTAFKQKAVDYFNWLNTGASGPYVSESYWIWAKPIESDNVKFLDADDLEVTEVTHRLMIDVTIQEHEPSEDTFDFREFGLLGIDKDELGKFVTDRLYFINYVTHGQITKDSNMELSRCIKLTFPIN